MMPSRVDRGLLGATMEDECVLVERARAGDREAFAGLVQAYQTPVYNLAYRMLGTAGEAEEATQETFLRLYRRLDTYDAQQKLSSWVLAIASHHCIDRLRRRRTVHLSLDEVPEAAMPSADEAPEHGLLQREREQEMQEMLATLPESYRLVIVLRYWYDLSYEEMAQTLGSSASAVKSRLHRARELLAASLARRSAEQPTRRLERRLPGHALP